MRYMISQGKPSSGETSEGEVSSEGGMCSAIRRVGGKLRGEDQKRN